jgi:hypothetical protein
MPRLFSFHLEPPRVESARKRPQRRSPHATLKRGIRHLLLKELFAMKRKLRIAVTSLAALFIVLLLANYDYIIEERARQFTAAAWDGVLRS